MKPPEFPPSSSRVASLLSKLSPCTILRAFAIIDQSSGKFQLPASDRWSIVPYEDQSVVIGDRHYDRKVMEHEAWMIHPKTVLGDQPIQVQLDLAE